MTPDTGRARAAAERFVPVGDGALSVLDVGAGSPTLVLVHGWASDRSDWARQLDALMVTSRMIAPDLRGFGRSAALPGPYRVSAMAEDLVTVIRDSRSGPVVLVGHSMGAVVAVLAATAHPELVRGIVSIDPSYGVPLDGWPERLALIDRVRDGGGSAAADAVRGWVGSDSPAGSADQIAERAARTDPTVLIESLESLFTAPDELCSRPRTEAALRALRCPVLALHADADEADWEAAALSDSGRSVALGGDGHWPQIGHSEVVNRTITDWLAQLEPQDLP